jgi:malonate decarboxylase gamma subunit
MTLDEILKGLFPSGHDVKTSAAGLITGAGKRKQGGSIA